MPTCSPRCSPGSTRCSTHERVVVSTAERRWPQVKSLRTVDALRARLDELGVELPVDDSVDPAGVLATPVAFGGHELPNRFAILPMEGWDAMADGRPTELVERRWSRFGASGCGLVWGGEAVAVHPDGRANPNQLCIGEHSVDDLGRLRSVLLDARPAGSPAPVVGLQLTHSGRWSRPTADGPQPRIAYRHAVLDGRVGAGDDAVLTDAELDALVVAFGDAAEVAAAAGFDFVDVKACHGYLGHELLSARSRTGRYGGELLAERAAFLLACLAEVRRRAPGLTLGVRLSVFDLGPWPIEARPLDEDDGRPRPFGAPGDDEPLALVDLLADAGVSSICITAGSPYYVPHIQRPAYFPPSDGYAPPEDPLVGVARLLDASRRVKAHRFELLVVASGVSYLQEHLVHVAQAVVREGWADVVGYGRMALSYPTLALDALAGRDLDRRHLCRTFSDCTTAPRHGLVSGCYPLDDLYKARPERATLATIKKGLRDG